MWAPQGPLINTIPEVAAHTQSCLHGFSVLIPPSHTHSLTPSQKAVALPQLWRAGCLSSPLCLSLAPDLAMPTLIRPPSRTLYSALSNVRITLSVCLAVWPASSFPQCWSRPPSTKQTQKNRIVVPSCRQKSHSSGSGIFELGTGLAADVEPRQERQAVEPKALHETTQRQCPVHHTPCTFEDGPN